MKQQLESSLQVVLKSLQAQGEIAALPALIQIEPTKDKQHGDFASNIAMVLAKSAHKKPREMAERIISLLPVIPGVAKIEIAGPGFINFYLDTHAITEVVATILMQKEKFGRSDMGRQKKILVEFVSSNPTGPLHVGHGRHAAFGDVVCNLLTAVGFNIHREYYVNDAGRQMDIIAISVWLRYLGLLGEEIIFPANGYQGGYVLDIARALKNKYEKLFLQTPADIFADLPKDLKDGGDKEIYIDALIERFKKLVGEAHYETILNFSLESVMADIADDMTEFGVHFDEFFSERQFVASDVMDKLLQTLKDSDYVYLKEGALWFRSTQFGDEKDRVLVRSNGQRTYFANDVAYHLNKFERGFDLVMDVFGSDHHGYLARMKAAIQAAGIDPERLIYLLGQFVTLYRNGEQVQMSTRGGNFVTLRELRQEVGNDAARYFYVMRKYDHHIDFDLDLAKSKSNENPVFYVQYAHARICSIFKQLKERQFVYNEANGLKHRDLLIEPEERDLLTILSRYPDTLAHAALQYEPHVLTNYLRDVASHFHVYYNAHVFLVDDENLRDARLSLVSATQQILKNGFQLIGISAPDGM